MKRKTLVFVLALLVVTLVVGCSKKEDVPNTAAQNATVEENNDQENDHGEDHDHGADHEHGEFEWIGEFELKAGTYLFHFGECEDETMDIALIKIGDNITDLEHNASHVMLSNKEVIKQDSTFEAKPDYAYTFEMNKDHGHINFIIKEDGIYAIVTEHLPSESTMQIFDGNNVEILPMREHEGSGHRH